MGNCFGNTSSSSEVDSDDVSLLQAVNEENYPPAYEFATDQYVCIFIQI